MSTTAMILCAGDNVRWNNYLGCRKHFVEIEGERLIDRTVRLFKKYVKGDFKIYVVGTDERYRIKGTELFIPKKDNSIGEADKFLNSKVFWNQDGRTVYLLGDVWFSEEAMKSICSYDKRKWMFFARPLKSKITGCSYGEPFAWSFYPEHFEKHEKSFKKVIQAWKKGRIHRCGGWQQYALLSGLPEFLLDIRVITRFAEYLKINLFKINDFTEDFDFPEDYDRWIMNRKKVLS